MIEVQDIVTGRIVARLRTLAAALEFCAKRNARFGVARTKIAPLCGSAAYAEWRKVS